MAGRRFMIEVHLYGRFRQFAQNKEATAESVVQVPWGEGDTIEAVIRRMGIDPAEASHLFLNGQYSGLRRRVKKGDRLGVFPSDMALLYRQYFPRIEEDG